MQNLVKYLRWSFWGKIVNYFQLLVIFVITFILDVWLSSKSGPVRVYDCYLRNRHGGIIANNCFFLVLLGNFGKLKTKFQLRFLLATILTFVFSISILIPNIKYSILILITSVSYPTEYSKSCSQILFDTCRTAIQLLS